MIAELVTGAALVSGAAFAALAGLGIVRFPDLYTRMHAATKAGTLGAGIVLLAVAIHFSAISVTLRVLAAIGFLVITAPVAAHMIGRAAYRAGVPLWKNSIADEWGLQRRRLAAADDQAAGPVPRSDP
jgi:multicomponent Na+:H+ antiporter subunit G